MALVLKKYALVLLFAVLFARQSHATTIVILTSKSGIVVGVDSQLTGEREDQRRMGIKIAAIKDRFVVASLGHEAASYTLGALKVIDYEFSAWINSVERSLPENISFDDLVAAIKTSSTHEFGSMTAIIGAGKVHPKNPEDIFEPWVQYVVAGYGPSQRVSVIEFYVDWDSKQLVGPFVVPVLAGCGDSCFYSLGINGAITDFPDRHSYAYHRAQAFVPEALRHIDLMPLESNIVEARALVCIEEETNPSTVGGGVVTFGILASNGRAYRQKDFSCKTGSRTPSEQNHKNKAATHN